MKKLAAILLGSILFTGSIFAQEWGGIVTNSTKDSISNFTIHNIEQSNGAYFWLNTAISKDSKWYLSSEAMYKFTYGYYGKEIGSVFNNVIDFDLMKLIGTSELSKGTFSLAAGRYFVSDNTAVIFSQNSDGLMLKYSKPTVTFSGYAGYTGLLNGLNVSMISANRTEAGETVAYSKPDKAKFYCLAHPVVPVILTVDFNSIAANQTLSIQGMGFFDLKDDLSAKAQRYYLDLNLKGPIINALFYDLNSAFGSTNFTAFTNYSKAMLLCYPVPMFSFKTGVEYASGNQAIFKTFTGVTSCTAYNSLYSPEYGGQLIPQLSIVYSASNIYTELMSKAVFKMPQNKITLGGIQENLSVIANVFSDFQTGLEVMVYYDITGNRETNCSGTLNIRLTF